MLRRTILAASRSGGVRSLVTRAPVTRDVVRRFVAGETADEALTAVRRLLGDGLAVSLDHLGEDTTDAADARRQAAAAVATLRRLTDEGLAAGTELSVKLSALGQAVDELLALDLARSVCEAAAAAGTTVTLDMEDHTTTDSTLAIGKALRVDFPLVGAVVQSYLRRTPADCADLAAQGARVRLCKGAYDEPASVAHTDRRAVDLAYVECLRALAEGGAYPMVATHDPRLVALTGPVMARAGLGADGYEHQMLYGIRPDEQRRLAASGLRVRVYVPWGVDWYGYFMRRLAERPANTAFFLRSLVTKG